MNTTDENNLIRRAIAAWFRAGDGYPLPQPNAAISTIESHRDRDYIVLRNVNGPLAVYRHKTNGLLKRLVRIPKVFQDNQQQEKAA